MKHFFWLFAFFFFVSLTLCSQSPTDVEEEPKAAKLLPETKIVNNVFNINVSASDSLDIRVLDSIITALDSAVNNRYISKIYGHDIFRKDSIRSYQPNSIVKIPDTYVLGSGDELTISIFGISQFDAQYIVNEKGFIQPTDMPKIFLKGLTWGQAKLLLKRRFRNYYSFRSEQFAVSLTEPRVITVNIFGEVERPGSYNLVATNTAFNALIAAGGPTESGSVREILITNGTEQKRLDVYELMQNPIQQFQYYLEDNIIIQVPTAKKVVRVSGAIGRPFDYELKENEGLVELIEYAGGLSANAVREIIQIKRYSGGRQLVLDVNSQDILENRTQFMLQNGDQILIRSIEEDLYNAVIVEGAVELPGEYSLESTPRLSDLVKKSVLKRDARTDASFLVRLNPDSTLKLIQVNLNEVLGKAGSAVDLSLQANDKLVINSQKYYADRTELKVKGAVRNEIEYPFDPDNSITLEQAILLAGGLDPEAAEEGYIIRQNLNNKNEREYLRINVIDAITNPNGPANIKVEPWDEIVVLEQSEYTDIDTVSISGAVRAPSSFQFDVSMSLNDLLILGGGLNAKASGKLDVFRIEMEDNENTKTIVTTVEVDKNLSIVKSPKDFKLQPNDYVVARAAPAFEKQTFVMIEGAVIFPGKYALLSENEKLASLVRRAGGLSAVANAEGAVVHRMSNEVDTIGNRLTNKMITNLQLAMLNEGSANNLILKKGDRLFIPKKDDVVYIEIQNTRAQSLFPERYSDGEKIGVKYTAGKSAKWYLDEYAGGIANGVKKKNVTVEYSNGAIQRVKNIWPFKKFPIPGKGSTIAVGIDESQIEEKQQNDTYPKTNKGVILYIDKNGEIKENIRDTEPNNPEE